MSTSEHAEPGVQRFADYAARRDTLFQPEYRSVAGGLLSLTALRQPAGRYVRPPFEEFTLGLMTRGSGTVRFRRGGEHSAELTNRLGWMGLSPADVENQFDLTGDAAFLVLSLPAARVRALREELGAEPRDFGRLHFTLFPDPLLKQMLLHLWDEAALAGPHIELFAEGALLAIVARLSRLALQSRRDPSAPMLALAVHARVLERLEAELDRKVTVRELASLAGMGEFEFVRAFRNATGLPPHQWLLQRRLQRACQLLNRTDEPLAAVAHMVGFSSQSHMTDVFRAKLGVTPGRYRREVQS